MWTYIALPVGADDSRTTIFNEPRNAFADGVGHQVADMEFLERIGIRVFHHDLLSRGPTSTRIVTGHNNLSGNKIVFDEKIDETRTGDLNGFHENRHVFFEFTYDFSRQDLGAGFQVFCICHGGIGREIAVAKIVRIIKTYGRSVNAASGDGLFQMGKQFIFHNAIVAKSKLGAYRAKLFL